MKAYYLRGTLLVLLSFVFIASLFAQHLDKAYNVLEQRGEIYIKFESSSGKELQDLSKTISIDKLDRKNSELDVFAYLNKEQFEIFKSKNISFEILTSPSMMTLATMCPNLTGMKSWDCYPTYDQYVSLMQSFESTYPQLCKLYEFGQSVNGRKLLAVKISDNVSSKEDEPEFLYTSSIHGDELTGYVLMLRLIDYLLVNYNTDSRISDLVNNAEIWINPLANIDGAYYGGNTTVFGATRGNYHNIDLNRNFPDPSAGQHPDGETWQTENIAMMNFLKSHNFVLAANFHGGEEVVNYPWDNWTSVEKLHADDNWYQEISHEYADTVQSNSTGYMTGFVDGVTNGGDWYEITGGRQDYMNYFRHSREVTIEISNIKTPSASNLPLYWNYNYRSFLNYINRVHFGIYGKITDQFGNPLKANVFLSGHDFFNSDIYSDTINGMYFRMLPEGNYHLVASLHGYVPAEFDITVLANSKIEQNIVLQKWPDGIQKIDVINYITNPFKDNLQICLDIPYCEKIEIALFDLNGKKILVQNENCISGTNKININTEELNQGIYLCCIKAGRCYLKHKLLKL